MKKKRAESSSTSSSSGINYEVFLNFRGPDTRNGLTDHLYKQLKDAGIQVFGDSENLHAGQEIKQELREVIKRSTISIAIFSKTYASSKHCLMELEQMWECRKYNEHTIIPIFYDVCPSDVKDEAGCFGRSVDQQARDGVDADTIKKWKEVLGEIGKLKGYERANMKGGDESELVKEVLRCVVGLLKKDDQRVTDKLAGIDLHVQEMMTKLGVVYGHGQAMRVCGEDVRVVGIWGMPGVGKTTLAKVIYNKIHKLFNGCSFVEVENLRGVSDRKEILEGVKLSQELLIADLLKEKLEPLRSYDKGIGKIGSLFSNVKVLIILDDVHRDEQIKGLVGDLSWFGSGSRIIVTTDEKDVFNSFTNEAVRPAVAEYPVGLMTYRDALRLFCKHAFQGNAIAPQDADEYDSLSREIVKAIGGIPLAIEVTGSYLYKNSKNIQIWKSNLQRLTKHQDNTVEAAFKVSYDSLDAETKEIFLDIACFFNGKDERIPSYMWESCDFFPPIGIKLLCDMCLLEIGENNELKMHALLRNFGRKHVEGKDLHKRCRFWNLRDARSIPEDGEGTESVECIGLTVREGRTVLFTCEKFRKMLNLRYLGLDRANIQGNTENLPPYLKWLDWRGCHFIPELRNMHLKKLVILDLSRSPVTKDSNVWSQIIETAKELKVLSLQGCDLLGASLKFSVTINLEILILEDCDLVSEIGTFISELESLKSLNLRNCKGVRQLPRELHRMKFLTELLIDGTGIKRIDIQSDSLTNLEKLSACRCGKLELISPIGHLTKLRSLALDGAINWRPGAFEFPPNLWRLSLRNCRMFEELPLSVGKLGLLEVMDLSDTKITKLPESVKDLTNLKTLKMERTHLKFFSENIVKLEKLEEIDFSGCRSLVTQDSCDISGLSSLRILRLSSSNVAGLPGGICDLPCLRTLDVGKCERLQALPKLPSSLVTLCWGSKIMASPKLTNLTNLKELCLNADEQPDAGSSNQTPNTWWIMGLTSLQTLELSLPNITNFPGDFRAFTQLRELTVSYMKELDLAQLPSRNLWTLRLKRCKIEEPNFSGLIYLSKLELEDCDLEKIDGLKDLQSLEVLNISRCKGIPNLNGLKYLRRLRKVGGIFSARPSLPISHPVELDICEDLKLLPVLNIIRGSGITNLNELKDVNQPKDGVEAAIESMEKMKDEAEQRTVDMEASYRNYAIAAVQNVVGIDDRAKQITDLLEMEVNDEVRIIGIYGTDGIGKTTLAKAVYKRISPGFDSCSFLAEVEETTQNSHGVQFLQNKLIHDILERDRQDISFDERIEDFLDIFREMKVLIVVDDVEKPSDLHAVVGDQLHWFGPGSRIIVTSKNSKILKEYDPAKASNYMVSELDHGQAFELFCKHAFWMQSSIPDYDELSNHIVDATEKLPLAVELIGSFLRGKSIQEWIKMEKSMKASTMSSQKTTVGLQELLDICYKELDQLQKDIFLDIACFISGVDARIASYMWPDCYLSSGCILMPLAKIGDNNELQMHRLLRRLGKRMFEQEGSGDPIGIKFYIQEKGMENVEALCFDFTAEDFQSMPDIKFLKLDNAKVSGNFEDAFASLRWLCWQRCPLDFSAKNFLLTELVILDLSWSKVTEDWGGWSEIKMEKLKVLNLTGCSDLLFTPDFSSYKSLEILILERCSHLVKLHPSIGNLERLVSLNLKFCSQLNGLPGELGCTTALKELFIDGTCLRQIPISIGNSKQLEILSGLKCSSLTHLPSSIRYLTTLSELSLDGAKISELPSSLGELLKLRRLSLRDCRNLEKLPYSIGEMGALEELDISATSISELPDSIRNLKSLRVLRMDSSFIRAFPGDIGNLCKLEELHASWCRSLKGAIRRDIEGLRRLRSLTLGHSGISSLPSEISTIHGLHTLDLIQCNEIEELPELPPSLIYLRVSSKRMKAMPLLGDLKELEELCLSDGDPKACRPPSAIEEIEGLEGLKTLKRLDISNCNLQNLNGIGQLTSLRSLILSNCDYLDSLPDLSNLTLLKVLEIRRCKMICQIEGLEKLTSLKQLKISECPAENSVQVQNMLKDVTARSVEKRRHGKPVATSLKRNTEEILLDTSNKRVEKMKYEADMQTSDRKYSFAAVQNLDGIDGHVEHIIDLLEMEVNDEPRIIGIYGTDGIGKTTLAEAVYDRISSCFDGCSFLAEVKETTENPRGIQFLQTKLICDMLGRDCEGPFEEKIGDFVDTFHELKVLIVVDDVEKQSDLHAIVGDHIHLFGLGSRIIVTSKNEKILEMKAHGEAHKEACTYEVCWLDNGQAFELFCKHAFRMQSSAHGYDGLANRILNAAEKLPLVVEVMGSYLRGKPIEEWKNMEELMIEFRTSSQKTSVGCKEILDMCYEALAPKQKHIFLAIACFISGVDARIASYMWPDSYCLSSDCILMPLAKIGKNNELQMHRLLRCLGKRIFEREESQDPSSRRFCTQDMVLKTMNREKGIKNVEAHDSCILTAENFASMPAISFLKLDDAKVSGDFTGAFPSLRWFCWKRCPLDFSAEKFVLRELVILDLSWSKVTEYWRGWEEIKMEKLKVLNLTGCSDLLFTPGFSGYKGLEILILERCSRLVKLDPSIGHLQGLVSLNLKFCSQLNGLPVELGCVTALKELFIDGTSVRQIPISIGNLKQLEILSGFNCFPLTDLPSSISYLIALSELSLDGAKITELPSSLGDLHKLRRLSLRDCRYLEELPYSIGEMGSLEELDISATTISELPDSIRNLKSLKVLRMDSSFIQAIPGEIGNLTKLEELYASWCRSLKGAIPSEIEGLRNLRSLTLGHSSISSLPREFSTIHGLHTLDLIECNEIEELPKLPPSLICLRVSSKRMKKIPLLEDLKELVDLCLCDGDPKARRPPSKRPMTESKEQQMIDKQPFSMSFPKLRKLELSLSLVTKLKFESADILRLETLVLPGSILKEVSEHPKKLRVFEFYDSAIEEIGGLEGLEALKRLDISNCKIKYLNGIGQLTSLRSLILSDCDDLSLPDLSNLKSLKVLEIRRCKMIRQIEGLDKLKSLEKLNINQCPAEDSVQVQNALKQVMARSMVR